MKRLMGNRVARTNRLLDEAGQPLQQAGKKLSCWRRYLQKVLNMESAVTEEALVDLEDLPLGNTSEVSKEDVERAVREL